ncbi:MAG: D-alanine--D-alanine ligase [Parcubacteria group bacterium]|nr:D-alanine--D-alanine ligase [Parcubacteria group bacterium]
MKNHNHKKIHVAVLFGGKSAEHEVSVRSARNIVAALDKNKYDITLIGIDKTGGWQTFSAPRLAAAKKIISSGPKTAGAIVPYNAGGKFLAKTDNGPKKVDVVFPVLHGPFGEDGTVQGLLKLANVPFVGAGVLGSAAGMDKDVAKRLWRDAGLPVARFLIYQSQEKNSAVYEKITRQLGSPLFIKPANLGSSVGITKARNKREFIAALKTAFAYDNKIIIEEYIKGREVECAVLGNENPRASVCGEIIVKHEFYSYEAKYLDENGARLSIPAAIPERVSKKIQALALKAFKAVDCEGLARVDFFLTKNEKIFINEINTMPGFTSISMYPKLWQASGISSAKLVDTLIKLALERFNKEQKLRTSL